MLFHGSFMQLGWWYQIIPECDFLSVKHYPRIQNISVEWYCMLAKKAGWINMVSLTGSRRYRTWWNGAVFNKPSLFVWDSFQSHLTEKLKEKCWLLNTTIAAVLPDKWKWISPNSSEKNPQIGHFFIKNPQTNFYTENKN